jgi:hypothetical protein
MGKKRVNKTEAEILKDMEMARKRTFIKESFYPALEKATVSVDEAAMLMQAVVALIMEEAMQTLRDKKMGAIKERLIKKLCPQDERLGAITTLVEQFDTQTLFEARGHFESMKQVIEQMKMDEMQNRPLSSLQANWDRYLN